MYRTCSVCGKIHDYNKKCIRKKHYRGGEERGLRSQTKWTLKSLEIRERSNYLCAVCLDKGIINHKNVEVHHITKVKDDQSLLLDDSNLICLCQEHHKDADKGKIDVEYLRSLATARDNSESPGGF